MDVKSELASQAVLEPQLLLQREVLAPPQVPAFLSVCSADSEQISQMSANHMSRVSPQVSQFPSLFPPDNEQINHKSTSHMPNYHSATDICHQEHLNNDGENNEILSPEQNLACGTQFVKTHNLEHMDNLQSQTHDENKTRDSLSGCTVVSIDSHENLDIDEMGRIKCSICGKSYKNNDCLTAHRSRDHPKENKYHCHICLKRFFTYGRCQAHIRAHGAPEPYKCSYCDKTFNYRKSVRYHHNKNHSNIPLPPEYETYQSRKSTVIIHVCAYCGAKFTTTDGFKIHMKCHHPEADPGQSCAKDVSKPYHCSQCNKSFIRAYTLRTHFIKHHPFVELPTQVLPKVRQFSHSMDYLCTKCGQGYRFKFTLDNHMESKHGIQRSQISRRYTKYDTTDKPYYCSECDKTFKFSKSLKYHLLKLHPNVPLPAVCPKNRNFKHKSSDNWDIDVVEVEDGEDKYRGKCDDDSLGIVLSTDKQVSGVTWIEEETGNELDCVDAQTESISIQINDIADECHCIADEPESDWQCADDYQTGDHPEILDNQPDNEFKLPVIMESKHRIQTQTSAQAKLADTTGYSRQEDPKTTEVDSPDDDDLNDHSTTTTDTDNYEDVTKDAGENMSKLPATTVNTQNCEDLITHTDNIHKCYECDITFKTKETFRKHMSRKHGQKRSLKCRVCDHYYTDAGTLSEHMKVHTKDEVYKCSQCDKCFKWLKTLKRHMITHTGQKPYQCKVCNEKFATPSKLAHHKTKHTTNSPAERPTYLCMYCGNSFLSQNGMAHHLKTHTGEKPYPCTVCDKAFISVKERKLHMMIHTGEKPYKCNLCNKRFSQSNTLKYHIATHADQNNSQPVKCPICHKGFPYQINLRNHMSTHSEARPYDCPVCTKCYKSQAQLTQHVTTHYDERNYECEQCDKKCHSKTALKKHKMAHSADRPHLCPHCGKTFKQANQLNTHVRKLHPQQLQEQDIFMCTHAQCGMAFTGKVGFDRHMRTHNEQKIHRCSECAQSFNLFKQLQTHMRIHSGHSPTKTNNVSNQLQTGIKVHSGHSSGDIDKPYECEECRKCFRSKHERGVHMATHTDVKPYRCTDCNSAFSIRGNLDKHVRRVHLKEKLFKCHTCLKEFASKQGLDIHSVVHSNERPYCCTMCAKSYKRAQTLKDHMEVHSVDHKYKCETCQQCFPYKTPLNVHLKTHSLEKPYPCDYCAKAFKLANQLRSHMSKWHTQTIPTF